jgi:hypothetical protein
MLFARIVLLVQALVMGGLGLAYWQLPYEMANLNGMLLMETASVSNMRVYYGGLQMGLALFLLWSMGSLERVRSALVLLVLIQLALALARLGALWQDGGVLDSFDLSSLIYKLLMAALALLALLVLRRHAPKPAWQPEPGDMTHEYPAPIRRADPTQPLLEQPRRLSGDPL